MDRLMGWVVGQRSIVMMVLGMLVMVVMMTAVVVMIKACLNLSRLEFDLE